MTGIALIILIGFTIWGNLTIKTTYYNITDKELPTAFDGYKIVQVSDLHNAVFGKENYRLIEKIRSEKPDIIVLTGDLIDSNHTDIATALDFTENISDIAPCYFITGNHEAWIDKADYNKLEKGLTTQGINILNNSFVRLYRDNQTILLAGIHDPAFTEDKDYENQIFTELEYMDYNDGNYKILLSHRPTSLEQYPFNKFNLIFSGHAHGGQFRLPFIGGVIAPDQGLFPKYDRGLFQNGKTTMVLSGGIGNSIIPIRINNRPEIVVTSLYQ